ncbi:hypothetical protein SODALDRAFT_338868 [Sodiomyces alkalinus F11]|uniref:TFIIS N-terminal domain-containing protein n=1 Tax=Sodiomyces alkalinus (strain CBS 110278 / VKM F-3762 / F11) TaxID=1314773 RepID=A0A3N2Q4A1_SODAK|nr:hypothetical protein SODALDRAFT_338868 [Sodiomyces alkalinus F11]ROT41603.1 hypothetical protein SODALDRAFT_338868 [Sodiomyces alkalinus F11]
MSDHNSPVGSPTPAEQDAPEIEELQQDDDNFAAPAEDLSDQESDVLSEIDENQFEDYDPETADIEDRPVAVDEDIAKTLKASKRKRPEGETVKKPKEGRREKKRQREEEEVTGEDGDFEEAASTRRPRRSGEPRARPQKKSPEPEIEENLTPEERRRRALERALDAAFKKPVKRRKRKNEEDLEDEIDDYIADLKVRMETACQDDAAAHEAGRPATHKLKLLPEVVALLNRTSVQHAVLDPENNVLQNVKFFLEPLNDGTMPAYNVQRDLLTALLTLPIEKETLLSSGIGKVILFYTRSKRPEIGIKRMAERLLGQWSRPLLNRTDDYRKRRIETREFDYEYEPPSLTRCFQPLPLYLPPPRQGSAYTLAERPITAREAERERILSNNVNSKRARPVGLPMSYTVAPVSTFNPSGAPDHRPIGAAGAEAFRRMTYKAKKR